MFPVLLELLVADFKNTPSSFRPLHSCVDQISSHQVSSVSRVNFSLKGTELIINMKTISSFLSVIILSTDVTAFAPLKLSLTSTTTFSSLHSTVDDKTEVREYFNTEGFNRWNKIYSESDDVNSVQLDIRTGHDQTIQKILYWIRADGDIAGKSVCDCGCGVGSLAIPLAQMGKQKGE
jgi:hypothetical protein